ncbi:hypothetical protein [Sphingomonas arenae]|uniref:hypothetical protein n=1 Tax=Sphingomonas arenae TaxID=2812555 RepID=UPI001966E981|nr:hypothetical protein [Sphingomonas arenae]
MSAATAELLADMIEDKGADWKILKPRGQTNNQQTWSKAVEEENQLFEIGLFVERELRADTRRGARKAIVYKAQLRFGVGSTKVNDAHRFIRQRLDEGMIQLALVSCPEI